ncbi:hypothetical protein ACFL1R_04065 [Candidatus Latescibacterota bacterium]
MKIISIVGARPNFMKIASLMCIFYAQPEIEPFLVHTGQNYDERMREIFFSELGITTPEAVLPIDGTTSLLLFGSTVLHLSTTATSLDAMTNLRRGTKDGARSVLMNIKSDDYPQTVN